MSQNAGSRGLGDMSLSTAAPMSTRDMRSAFLSLAAIRDLLRATVAKRLPASEVDDVVQATVLEAQASVTYPSERKAFERWLCSKGRSNAIDWLRSRARAERFLGTREGEDADGVPGTSVDLEHDTRERLAFALAHLESRSSWKGARWLVARARGASFEEIAAAEGVDDAAVRRGVARAQLGVRVAWSAIAVAAVVYAIAHGLVFGPHYHEANPRPTPPTIQEPAPAPAPVAPGPASTVPSPSEEHRAVGSKTVRHQ